MTTARAAIALLCAPLLAVGVAACGSTVSTSSFKGEAQKVAQTVAHLQSHASPPEPSKICGEDLAKSTVARLNAAGGCKQALEKQLKEIDNFEATVQSVAISGATATAQVKSVWGGKQRVRTMTFAREGGKWRITGLG